MPNIPFKVTFECEKLPELGTMFKMLEEFPLIEPAVGWNESTVFDIAGAMEVKNIRKVLGWSLFYFKVAVGSLAGGTS